MSELWGVASGIQQSNADQQQRMLTNLQIQEGTQNLAAGDIKLKQANLQLQQQERMLELLKGATTASSRGTPGQQASAQSEAMAGNMDMLANFALESGMPEQAKDYVNTASTIRKNQASIEENQAKLQQQHAQLTSSLMANVHDQQSFDSALLLYQLETGKKSPFAGQRFTPQLAEQIRNRATTILQQAEIKRNEAQATEATARASEDTARLPLIEAQKKEADARTDYLKKHGGAHALPTAGDVKVITDLMSSQYDLDTSQDQANARVLARPVAERMKEMMAENPALTQSAAARRAYQEALNRGDMGGMTPKKEMPGTSHAKPLTMPKDQRGLKENKWYTDPRLGPEPRLYVNGQFWTQAELDKQDTESESEDDSEEAEED